MSHRPRGTNSPAESVYRRLGSLCPAVRLGSSLWWYAASNSAGGTCPRGSRSRRWLNQSTHSKVAYSTSPPPPRPTPADQLGLEQADDRLGQRVVVGIAAGTDGGRRAGLREPFGVADGQVLGGFNWSSQHLDSEELRWEHGASAAIGAVVPPMRSPGRPPVARREHRQRFWKAIARGLSSEDAAVAAGCRRRWERGGSGKVAACHRPVWPRCRAATCRSPSAKRSRSCRPRASACARSLGGSAVRRRRSRGSCAATPRPVAAAWSIGPRPRSGTPIGVPSARRWPSSPPTTRCGSTCRTGSPGVITGPTARRCRVPRFAGSVAVTGAARTGAGPRRGVRSRSRTGSGSTSPMMSRCGSRTRRSTRPCTSRAAARCAVS